MINDISKFLLIFLELRFTCAYQNQLYQDFVNLNGKLVWLKMHNPKTFSDYASYEPYPLDYNAEVALNDYGMMDEVRNNEEFRRYQDYLDYLQGSIYQETESGTGYI